MNSSDWELIDRCRSGNAAAYEPLVRRHEGSAMAFARALLGDEDDAADAVQRAFVRAYGTLSRLREGSAFGPWFRTILRTICLDELRRRKRWRSVSMDESTRELPWSESDAPLALERQESAREVRDALALLSPEHRAVLVLKEIEELGYSDIARTLDVPAGTVASRLYHARAALARILRERGITPEHVRS